MEKFPLFIHKHMSESGEDLESILEDKEFLVIKARIIYKTNIPGALEFLKKNGIDIKQSRYYEILAIIDKKCKEKLYKIAQNIPAVHTEEIEKYAMLEAGMLKAYEAIDAEKEPMKKIQAGSIIIQLQPYYTSLIDATRYVLENNVKDTSRKESTVLPEQ